MKDKYNIVFYKTQNNKSPVLEFIQSLNKPVRNKVFKAIDLLKELGYEMTMPKAKSIGQGISELRIADSEQNVRVFYFFCDGTNIILTNGFVKKTQKMPDSEFKLAVKYKTDYLRRHNHD